MLAKISPLVTAKNLLASVFCSLESQRFPFYSSRVPLSGTQIVTCLPKYKFYKRSLLF